VGEGQFSEVQVGKKCTTLLLNTRTKDGEKMNMFPELFMVSWLQILAIHLKTIECYDAQYIYMCN
jgi:hypothetical protein